MAEVRNTDLKTFSPDPGLLEVDSVVSAQGSGYYDVYALEEGSRISGPQPLTGHPPQQNGVGGEHRLVSNIERDGRLESRDRLDDFIRAKGRAIEEMDKVYQICEDLHAENERLRREGGLCTNCRAPLSGPLTEDERTIEGQNLQRELREANALIEQLQHRCQELLCVDEGARLNNGSCDEAEGDQQHSSTTRARERSPTTPKQTESIGNAFQSVDPVIQAVNKRRPDIGEGSMIPGGAPAPTAKPAVVEQPRTPSPEDCAIFLADIIKPEEIKTLFRNLGLNSVSIADLEVRHPKDPKEYRIDGIKTGIVSAKGDRITFLLDALEKSKLNHQVDLFCEEFNIQRTVRVSPMQANGTASAKQPLQASSTDDFADSPCLEPLNDFETVLQPYLNDPASIHTIAVELSKEADFTTSQLRKFKSSFLGWKLQHRTKLEKECTSRLTMDVLNFWASVEVERMKGPKPAQGIEYLAKALRASERLAILEKLKGYLHKGVVGPSLRRDLYLRNISPYHLKVEIIRYLGLRKEAGQDDWRALTEHIGHGSMIQFWEQKPDPADTLWNVWQTRNDATIGKLYDWAISKNRLDIAAVLEKEA